MVRSLIPPLQPSRYHGSYPLTPASRPHPRPRTHPVKSPQSSPAVGIAFCLIIVRLGHILPEAREDTWEASSRTPSFRTRPSGQVAIEFPKIEVQQEVYTGEPEGFPMESLESGKQDYVNSADDLRKTFPPPNLHSAPTGGCVYTCTGTQ